MFRTRQLFAARLHELLALTRVVVQARGDRNDKASNIVSEVFKNCGMGGRLQWSRSCRNQMIFEN